MENFSGKGRPYGGIGWIVKKSLYDPYNVKIVFNNRRMSCLEIGDITIIGVYLTSNDNSKESMIGHEMDLTELEILVEKLESFKKKYIIVGDFNSDPGRKKTYDKKLIDFLDKRNLECLESKYSTQIKYTYTNGIHSSKIDHVIGPKTQTNFVEDVKILQPDQLNLSDHLPLKTTLKISAKNKQEKINNGEKKKEKKTSIDWNNPNNQIEYAQLLQTEIINSRLIENLNIMSDCNIKSVLDETINSLHSLMAKCSKTIAKQLKYPKIKKKSKEWWDDNMEKIHSEMKQQLWKYKNSQYKDINSKIKYKRLKRDFRNLQRKKMSELDRQFIKLLNRTNDQNKMWKIIKRKNKKKISCQIETIKLKELFHDHFNSKIIEPNKENLEYSTKAKKRIDEYEEEIERDKPKHYAVNRLNLANIIKKLPNGKSSGFNDIINENYKYGSSQQLVELVAKIIEIIVNNGIIPSFFNIGKISPVIKDEKQSQCDANNVRPITISDTLANIYEKIVLSELNDSHKGTPNQFGFTENSSCNHAVFVLKETILNYKKKNKPIYVCAIDASKAFDKVNRQILFYKLIGKVNPLIWRSLKRYYENSLALVTNQDQVSGIFKTTVGVKQGGPLSPKLFSIYIEELVQLIEKEQLGINAHGQQIAIILYADDILLICEEKDKLNRAIKICEQYGEKNEIKFNPEKTQLIVFGNKKQREQPTEIMMNQKKIDKVHKFKYLGVMINSKNNNNDHTEQRIKKTIRSFHQINRLGITNPELRIKFKTQFYKTFCRPILAYGCEPLKINILQMKKLKKTEGALIKKTLGIPKKSKTTKLMTALEMESTDTMLLKRKLKFVKNLCANSFTKIFINNLLTNESETVKKINKNSIINELEVLFEQNIEDCDELNQLCDSKTREIIINHKLMKKDGVVESIKYCLNTHLSDPKSHRILELLTKPY
ncbi:unnamed protein product [Brachionus calyciflorus]|uniref:Reverse transcriptase domain-containing protein n=1 Tax=Brachionus calyciflorus TaxID=104777 RepID=A0A813Z459_9BILA|nr:unnamed protein product [Brachionus calyciflorus]